MKMFLRSIEHVRKVKTSRITRETFTSVRNSRAFVRARKCVENHSNSVDFGCAHIQRTLRSPDEDVLT